LLLAGGTLAQADTISYSDSVSGVTDWAQALVFPQLPSYYTLTGVTIDLSSTFSSTFTITNTSGTTWGTGSSARRNLDIYLGSSPVDLAVDADNPNGPGSPWLSLLSTALNISGLANGASKSGTETGSAGPSDGNYTDNPTLSYFSGNGTVSLDLYTESGFTMTIHNGNSYDSTELTSATVTGIVTYDYIVPEPSTIAMVGLGGLALLCYRRTTR
jgi:hypothetical protein